MRISDWSSDVCSSDLCRICLTAFYDTGTGTSNTRTTFRDPSPHRIIRRCRNINLLPISYASLPRLRGRLTLLRRSEEHTSELQSLIRISYAVFCLKKKKKHNHNA